jgi:hypothetical protein
MFVAFNLVLTMVHESIHVAICNTYGGQGTMNLLQIRATTTCVGEPNDTAKYLNSWTEIIGYNFSMFMNVYMVFKFIDTMLKEMGD